MAKNNVLETWARADARLSAAYQRLGAVEPRMNGRSFQSFISEADKQDEGELDEEHELRMKHWRMFLDFIFCYGPSPARTVKRLYAMAYGTRRGPCLLGMNITEVSELLGEVRASGSNRLRCEFVELLEAWGFKACAVAGLKSSSAVEKYRRAAAGNTSRKRGRRKGDAAR